MAMDTLGIRVGKLAIIFFDNSFTPTYIPVPFMYSEAKELCALSLIRKSLPEGNITKTRQGVINDPIKLEMQRRQYPMTQKESFQIKDDWD